MSLRKYLKIIYYVLILLLISNISSAEETLISLEPSSITINIPIQRINIGQSFNFTVDIDTNLVNVSGAQIYLNIDSSKIRINNISESNFFKHNTPTSNLNTFFRSQSILQGFLIYSVILGPYNVSKPETFININATAIGYGNSSIGIYNSIIVTPDGSSLIPLLINNKTINVVLIYDINNDRVVDINDLLIIVNHYNEYTSYPYPAYDINQDGKVDIRDLVLVSRHYGEVY